MLKILDQSIRGKQLHASICEILADGEADIVTMPEIVRDGRVNVKPLPGSVACTANGAARYILSPAGVWTKVVG